MPELWLLLRGIGIGMLFSVPVGPINVMCIREAFQFGFRVGLAAALGAVAADVTFATMAAFGLTAIADQVEAYTLVFQLVAALALITVGLRVARSTHRFQLDDEEMSAPRAALRAFGLTLTNPATVLGFIAVFGALGEFAPGPGHYVGALFLVAGVGLGGLIWWTALVTLIALIRTRISLRALERINHAAGAVLLLCGFGLLAHVAWFVIKSLS